MSDSFQRCELHRIVQMIGGFLGPVMISVNPLKLLCQRSFDFTGTATRGRHFILGTMNSIAIHRDGGFPWRSVPILPSAGGETIRFVLLFIPKSRIA